MTSSPPPRYSASLELDIPAMRSLRVDKPQSSSRANPVRRMRKPEQRSPAPRKLRPPPPPPAAAAAAAAKVKQTPAKVHNNGSDTKKELERRLAALHKANVNLRERGDRLGRELAALHAEENAIEQERDRLQQLWMCSRSEVANERESRHDLERVVQRMKTHNELTIAQLQQKMRSLLLAARSQVVSATQTELVYVGGPFEEREVQTVDELTRDKANIHLRENDAMLLKLIDEMEREKLNAQSDLKYAIVQLEQRMKEDHESQLRCLREEKLRQLEEISAAHADELRTIEDEMVESREKAADDIAQLHDEVAGLEADRAELRMQLEVQRAQVERAEHIAATYSREKDRIEKEHAKLLSRTDAVNRDAASMERMKRDVAKYREINEILMVEYAKLEAERDELAAAVQHGVARLETLNQISHNRLNEKLDEIDRRL